MSTCMILLGAEFADCYAAAWANASIIANPSAISVVYSHTQGHARELPYNLLGRQDLNIRTV